MGIFEAWRTLSAKKLLFALNAAAACSISFEGYAQGLMGGVNISPDYVETMGLEGKPSKLGGVVCVYYLGALVGGFSGGWLADKIGRRRALALGCLWCILGGSLQASAQNVEWMIVARVITGQGVGYLMTVTPAWSAEVAAAEERGRMICLIFLLNYGGIFVAYWLGYGMSFSGDGRGPIRWRLPQACQVIPALILFVSVWFLPESPRWLVKQGRADEALFILTRLRGDGDENHPAVKSEYNDIITMVESERSGGIRNSYLGMLLGYKWGKLHMARRVQLAAWIQILMQFGTGITATTIYSPTIFSQAGYSEDKAQWLSALNNSVGILGTLINAFNIDKLGRRKTLFYGAIGQAVCLFLSGGLSRLLVDNPDKAAQYGAASSAFIFLFTLVFSSTWLMVPFILPAEIFPTEVRAKGNAFGVAGWAVGFGAGTLFTPVMFDAVQENTFYLYAGLNLLYIPVIYCFWPETAKRSLEEMDLLFASDSMFAWNMEKEFQRLMAQGGVQGVAGALAARGADDIEASCSTAETEKPEVEHREMHKE